MQKEHFASKEFEKKNCFQIITMEIHSNFTKKFQISKFVIIVIDYLQITASVQ